MIKFKDDFYFGSAASATQTEGANDIDGKGQNIWDYWYETEGFRFHNNIGPQDASTFYKNYKSDIALFKEIGHNSFRLSISWSRLFPKGHGKVNSKAVEFYNNVINEMIKSGVEPFVNLFHFDMPMDLQNIGGWENREVVRYYAEYAKKCFEIFGDRVKHWFTFNEPMVHVECGYYMGHHYPYKVDPKAAVQVAYHTALASALAIRDYKTLNLGGKIGMIINLSPCYPRSEHPADLKAAHIADLFCNKGFLDPAANGEFTKELVEIIKKHDLMPVTTKEDLDVIKENKVNFLGVNYYQPRRVCAKAHMPNPEAPFTPEYYYDAYVMPGRKINPHRGWEIYEKGIYDIAINIRDNYGNIEWMITENGMGVEGEEKFMVDGVIQDDYRIEFYKEHLTWLHKAIEEGSNCVGYHAWTFIDNWSWLNAYKNRYGFVSLDLETGKRTIKKSGRWFKELSDNKGF
ncbi:glycoside hydrolase family 1 protein [Clostridium sp.]|uniref:glycoside hydrolase family 1 protein n=1 Tax=Clostridium sp. TaxID=1506 RepID=UPI0026144515|nr:glycoside hydrolase family 1 protein [Clostridium sp.]